MIDAVIVTANSRTMVLRCLEHLPPGAGVRPIIVDNGSRDGTADAVATARDDATVLRLAQPTGLAHAFNRGATAGDGELLLFLNDDILATEGTVDRLVAELRGRPGAVAAAGRLVEPDTLATQERYLPARFPTASTLALLASGLATLWPANRYTTAMPELLSNRTRTVEVDQPAGACLLIPRAVYERIGGWDERFFFWYEDVDICRRLAREGTILWVPAAPFRHEGGASFAKRDRLWSLRTMLHGLLQYAGVHMGRRRRAALGALLVATSVLRVGVFTMLRRPDDAELYRAVGAAAAALARGRSVPSLY